MRSWVLFVLVLVVACGGRRQVYDHELQTSGPFPVQGGLCFLNSTLGEMIRVQITELGVDSSRVFLAPGPRSVTEVMNHDLLAVLHDDERQAGVTLLDSHTLQRVDWLPLSERFDRMVVSPSARYGLACFSRSATTNSSGLRNLNQIQILDFDDRRVHPPLALQTGGLSPRGIGFLPAGHPAYDDIAAIQVDNGLVILDVAEPSPAPLWLRFTNSPGGQAVPAEVDAGPFGAGGGYLYVRLQGSDDVLSVHLTREEGRLKRSINFLNTPAGAGPSDLLVLGGVEFADKVLTVYSASPGGAAILDANAIQTDERTFLFDGQVTHARRLMSEDESKEFVAVFRADSTSSRVFIIDPVSGAVETVHLQDPIASVSGPGDGAYLVVFHQDLGASATPGMRIIRMVRNPGSGRYAHRIATFSLQLDLVDFEFAETGDVMLAALENSRSAFVLNLVSGVYASIALDRLSIGAGLVPGTEWVYFLHPHPLGSLTLAPIGNFDRDHAVTLEGLMLEGLLNPR